MFERVFFLLSMAVREVKNKEWTLFQLNALPHKVIYWFANEVMDMADEQSKNNNIKLMEGWVQMISRDEILEVIGKSKLFTLLKYLNSNKEHLPDKQEHLPDKFTPLLPNDVFALSDSEKIAFKMNMKMIQQM